MGELDVADVRRWAAVYGIDVSARGRLPARVVASYLAADGGPPLPSAVEPPVPQRPPVIPRPQGTPTGTGTGRESQRAGPSKRGRASTGGLWRDVTQLNAYSHTNPRCHVLATSAVQRITPQQERDAQLRPCPTCRPQETQPQGPHVVTLAAAYIQAPPIASTMRVRGTASGGGAPGLGRRR